MTKKEINILYDFANNEYTSYCYDWHGFDWKVILPLINKMIIYNKELLQQLREKDKAINEAIKYAKNTKAVEYGKSFDTDGKEFYINEFWFIKDILEILERGKNEKQKIFFNS